jgi:ferredoxin
LLPGAGRVLLIVGALLPLLFVAFAALSLREKEPRAARRSLALAGVGAIPALAALWAPPWIQILLLVALVLAAAGLLALLLPIGRVERRNDTPRTRFDERDITFARAELEPGSQAYEAYYARNPEKRRGDEAIRRAPGLLSLEARHADPLAFGSAEASFMLTEALYEAVDGAVGKRRLDLSAAGWTGAIKALARFYGAREVGVAAAQPYHFYTHVGRQRGDYGAPVEAEHRYAVAVTVEMDHSMIGPAPHGAVVMESARQYVEAARIALQLAAFIRWQGYPARAHIDGNYRVIAPLVARDAGLGEIGRMGLLMTPNLGPRVRLAVVTTDLPLVADGRTPKPSVLDFCRLCNKCAENCPSRAIPFGDREEIEGAYRWRIDAERCFHYWNVVGTDCARCMRVCPYAHPDQPLHTLVRIAIRLSRGARRAALWLDDFFYGKEPGAAPAPEWIREVDRGS